ncbi:MAG: biotin/lipoyl-containing protein [Bacteroidota bacterium]
MQFQALVHDRTVDLALDGTDLTVDGEAVEARVERIAEREVLLLLDGQSYSFTAEPQRDGTLALTHAGQRLQVRLKNERDLLLEQFGMDTSDSAAERELRAPMPGLVLSVLAEPGQEVPEGTGLVVLEAMKMENELRAAAAGTVATVHVEPGQAVGKNDLLVSFAE